MAADPIAEYQQSLRDLERARNEAERIVQVITRAASLLEHWQDVRVSDVNVSFPVGIPQANIINGKDWPSAQQLAEALSRYHSTLHEVNNAYRRLPWDQRGVVRPPPEH